MNDQENHGWNMVWAGVGLTVAGFLLTWFLSSAELFGLRGIPYCVVAGALCVAYVAAIYIVVRKFFGKKK